MRYVWKSAKPPSEHNVVIMLFIKATWDAKASEILIHSFRKSKQFQHAN